jgi:hypothetical protein
MELWFDSILLGCVSNVIQDDGTFSGTISFVAQEGASPVANELRKYVAFCEDWNERTRTQHDAPSVSEFDPFAAIVHSGKWFTRSGDVRSAVRDAPVFFRGDEVSWRSA